MLVVVVKNDVKLGAALGIHDVATATETEAKL